MRLNVHNRASLHLCGTVIHTAAAHNQALELELNFQINENQLDLTDFESLFDSEWFPRVKKLTLVIMKKPAPHPVVDIQTSSTDTTDDLEPEYHLWEATEGPTSFESYAFISALHSPRHRKTKS